MSETHAGDLPPSPEFVAACERGAVFLRDPNTPLARFTAAEPTAEGVVAHHGELAQLRAEDARLLVLADHWFHDGGDTCECGYWAEFDSVKRHHIEDALTEREPGATSEEERCGAPGCRMPAGHNMGQADVPENHGRRAGGQRPRGCVAHDMARTDCVGCGCLLGPFWWKKGEEWKP